MQKTIMVATLALVATGTLAATFPSPPLYPSFTERRAKIVDVDPKSSTEVVPTGIDAKGRVYGFYFDTNFVRHGFMRRVNGSFKTFEAPNAGTGAEHGTTPNAVNAAGDIAGYYTTDGDDADHGFVLIGTKYTEFDPKNAQTTTPTGINNSDEVTGSFVSSKALEVSFLREPNGHITTFKAPGASTSPGSGTAAECIDDHGVIAGEFNGTDNKFHGFVRSANGKVTTFDPPKSVSTSANAINAAGTIVGSFSTKDDVSHGYLRLADGSIQVFDLGGDASDDTSVNAINDNGDFTGTIIDKKRESIGFLRTAKGKVTKFAVAATANIQGGGTHPATINASDAIAGTADDASDIPHGFVRIP
jgi:uncharacterized membrane protein